jgi:hypothetical protein
LNAGHSMNLSELFADEDYRFQMGLRRGSAAEFFQSTARHKALVEERQHWLRDEPQTYSAFLPESLASLDECVALARDWESITPEEQSSFVALNAPHERGLQLGEIWEPDFLLLRPDAAGRFRLVGGCVCFPSSWSLTEKIGQPMEFIHGPVPGLNAQLGRSIEAFLAKFTPGAAWLRHNWGLSRSPQLNQHPSRPLPRLDGSVALAEVWLRVERQALVALPASGGVLFGIRISMHSLVEVKKDATVAERLACALRTMPTEVAAYKGLTTARERVADLLGQFS